MSDEILRMLRANDARLSLTEVKEVPALYLPWAQRMLNPFPLASSGGVWGDMVQPWAVNIRAFYVSVYVVAPNNGTNYWVLTLNDAAAAILASVDTSLIAANAFARLSDTTIAQPSAANAVMPLFATAVGAPGAIFIVPTVALLRTGN